METALNYKEFGITYYTIGGTTAINYMGITIKKYIGCGELKGLLLAKKYIDNLY